VETSWLTYREAADTLGLPSPAAAKLRAKRGRWPKRQGNDGLVRVEIPEGTTPHRSRIDPVSPKADDPASISDRSGIDAALQALREQLNAAGERETRLATELAAAEAKTGQAITAVEAHNATLKADVERLEAQLRVEADRLSAAEARAEKQTAELLEQNAQHAADLAAERARTEKAIEVFSVLAKRLDALAIERARPWWRRLVDRN
jgi:hypothetical protein